MLLASLLALLSILFLTLLSETLLAPLLAPLSVPISALFSTPLSAHSPPGSWPCSQHSSLPALGPSLRTTLGTTLQSWKKLHTARVDIIPCIEDILARKSRTFVVILFSLWGDSIIIEDLIEDWWSFISMVRNIYYNNQEWELKNNG